MNCSSSDKLQKTTSYGDRSLALLLSEESDDTEELYATCDESDGTGNDVEGEAVLPVSAASNTKRSKSLISPKSDLKNKTQPLSTNDNQSSSSYGHFSNTAHTLLGADVTDAVSSMDIDDDSDIDEKIKAMERDEGRDSPCMVPPVSKRRRFKLIGSNTSSSFGSLVREEGKLLDNTRSMQTLEVAFASTDLLPPIQKEEMYEIFERKMNYDKTDVIRLFTNKTMRSMRILRDHGLAHRGETMGQVTWIPLGVENVEFPGATEWNNNDLFPEGVGRRTRAAYTRARRSLCLSNIGTESAAKDFADDVYEFKANDEDDFVEEDVGRDPDFEVKEDKPKQGKGKGKGKKSEKVGGGRGRSRKGGKVENHPSIQDFYSPVVTKDSEYEQMITETGNMSPLTAACYRPGLSGYNQQRLGRSSPRSKSDMGECPLCGQKFDMVLLENHASSCEG